MKFIQNIFQMRIRLLMSQFHRFLFLLMLYGLFLVIPKSLPLLVNEIRPLHGASSYHLGIDIGAPAHATLVAICSGRVSFVGFKGANGYMITLLSAQKDYTISYCHVDPSILVATGDWVEKGEIIRICWSKKCIWHPQ